MSTDAPEVLVSVDGHVATIRFNRPRVMNAINSAAAGAVLAAVQQSAQWRALVITGDQKSFSSGADLKEYRDPDVAMPRPRDACESVAALPMPVIAAIEGYCLAGGLELALGCDFLVASETARFALTESQRGFIPGGGGTQRLPRRIGVARAKEMLLFGAQIDAQKAFDWGLIDRLVPAGRAYAEAQAMAVRLAQGAPLALREIKRLVREGMEMPLAQALRLEREGNVRVDATFDAQEGRRAFVEKREPRFEAR